MKKDNSGGCVKQKGRKIGERSSDGFEAQAQSRIDGRRWQETAFSLGNEKSREEEGKERVISGVAGLGGTYLIPLQWGCSSPGKGQQWERPCQSEKLAWPCEPARAGSVSVPRKARDSSPLQNDQTRLGP